MGAFVALLIIVPWGYAVVPLAFLDFGLTQSMLRDVRGLSGYLELCPGCWAVLRREEARWIRPSSVAVAAEPVRG
ncbi:hypothetical protein [Chromohalobacter sp. 48-RD10]|uniref:hypothetical protein n=1 Tax=Chromohalobacter sp. 48-RD10 TaxID=2994063 RepID=UPI0024691D64|nr:hypothetical protein [Chromohalobacter sp. 48-RD10]